MTFVRFINNDSPIEMKGIYIDGKISRIHGSFFGQFTVTEEEYSLSDVQLLPPLLPQTICMMGKNSYIKSSTSLSANNAVKMRHEKLLCIPRVGFIVKEKGPVPFGNCLILDFVPEIADYTASSYGYTLMNAITKGVCDISCSFNGTKLDFSAAELLKAMKEAASYVNLTAGDIVALPLAEATACQSGDEFVINGEIALRAVLS